MKKLAVLLQAFQTETSAKDNSDISMAFELLTQEIYKLCPILHQASGGRQPKQGPKVDVPVLWSLGGGAVTLSGAHGPLTIHKDYAGHGSR